MLTKFAALALTAVLCSGCIRSATLVKVKADGSGTIEQTMLVNLGLMKGMFAGLGGQTTTQTSGTVDEADLKRAAERMGEGVTLVSATPVKEADGFAGSKAIFSFTDISKVRIDQDPNLSGANTGGLSTPAKTSNPVSFAMSKGTDGESTLTVTVNDPPTVATDKPAGGAAGGPDMANPQMLDMMKSMFQGFKIGIDVEVAGKILKTNADHVAGSRVTLLEMDLGALLQDEAKLREIQKVLGPTASIAELKPYLKDVKGLKVNDPVVTIAFR